MRGSHRLFHFRMATTIRATIIALNAALLARGWTTTAPLYHQTPFTLTPPSSWSPFTTRRRQPVATGPTRHWTPVQRHRPTQPLFRAKDNDNDDDDNDDDEKVVRRTTFSEAGASLVDEEDQQRMEQMGDFDSNPDYQTDSIEKMRAAIRARTKDLGMEKSKVSADYIRKREQTAQAAGSAQAAGEDSNMFAGLDLSQISSTKQQQSSQWNEDMPSMLYNPEDELSTAEQQAVDPVMQQSLVGQALNELSNAKWPGPGAALWEVGLMLVVIAVTALLIIGWDDVLRNTYTSIGFIPSKADLMNYASRFDGLDLPKGWTNNMSEGDIQQLETITDSASSAAASGLPGL